MYNRTIIFSAFVWLQLSTTASLLWTLWELDVSNHAWEVHVESHQLSPISWVPVETTRHRATKSLGHSLGGHWATIRPSSTLVLHSATGSRCSTRPSSSTLSTSGQLECSLSSLRIPPKKNMVNPGKPFFNIIGFSTSKIYYLSIYIYIWLLYDCLNKNIKARNGWTSPMFDLLKA